MSNVLVTSTGSVAADITLKSLKRMGFRVVGCNIYPKEWIVESCEMDAFYQAPPVSDQENYLAFMKDLCVKEKVEYLLPMIDYEIDLLNCNREWFEEQGVTLCMSPKESLDIIRNKKSLAEFIEINCPDTLSIPTKKMADIEDLEWSFPIVCKPYNGRSSQGLRYIYTNAEWEKAKKEVEQESYIVQPYISGPRIVVEIVRQDTPNKVIAMTRRELISTPHGCSLTVLTYQDKKLEKAASNLANALGVIGDVNFEYILDDDGAYHFIECNPRFSAGCEFSCMSGYDCIENHIKCFMGQEIEDYHFKHNMIIARKYEEYVTATNIDVPYGKTCN